MLIFANLQKSYDPRNCVFTLYFVKELMVLSKIAYALTLNGSRLGLLSVSFCKFTTELWPLIIVRILFLLNIFRTN